MSGQQQKPYGQSSQGVQSQLPAAQSWLSSLPGYSAPASRPGTDASAENAGQPGQQQTARPAVHTSQPNLLPQLVYAGQQPINPHGYPAAILAGVQMVSAPQMGASAMQTLQNYSGAMYRPMGSAGQTYNGQLAPLASTQQPSRPSPAARPPVQTTATIYQQNPKVQTGQQARPPVVQHQQPAGIPPSRPAYPQPTQPAYLSEEDRKVLPKRSLKRKAEAAVGDIRAEVEPELESALVVMADEFISNAVAFACGLPRRRKSQRLEAADVAGYLERTWQLHIPGFEGPNVRAYRKHAAGPEHQERTAAVRKARAAAAKAIPQKE